MRILLDTHAVIWWTGNPADRAKVSHAVQDLIHDASNDIWVSAVTAWEMAIKAQSGKLQIASGLLDNYEARVAALGWSSLPILPQHGITAARLPGSHKDHFDRMLAAQALAEGLTLATRDPVFAAYGVKTVW
jgi:PIN domain nuclease of toxin-antitoxin system